MTINTACVGVYFLVIGLALGLLLIMRHFVGAFGQIMDFYRFFKYVNNKYILIWKSGCLDEPFKTFAF